MTENINNNQEIELDENHLIQIRKEKLKDLQDSGKNPFEITKFNIDLSNPISIIYNNIQMPEIWNIN